MAALLKLLSGVATATALLMALLAATGDWLYFVTSIPVASAVIVTAIFYSRKERRHGDRSGSRLGV